MKKFSFGVVAAVTLLFVTTSCKDDIDALFLNPNASTDTKIEYLFTDALLNNGSSLRVGYNPSGYYLILRQITNWAYLTGVADNGADMMNVIGNTSNGMWNAYYNGTGIRLKEIEEVYATLDDDLKSRYDVYLSLSKILRAYSTAKITDLYGDMPYTEAFTGRTAEPNLFPAYDTQESIYKSVIADLKEASDALNSVTLRTDPDDGWKEHRALLSQDVFLKGDLAKWQMFANSIRLRLAMRMSEADPATAQSVVSEILTGNYPLVETNSDNILQPAEGPDGLNLVGGGGGHFGRAIEDSGSNVFANKLMVDMMNAASDPRLAAHFSPNGAGDIVGLPTSPDDQGGLTINTTNFSIINPELIRNNEHFPGVVITASEVRLLRAEAIIRGWVSGDAEAEYNAALEESVDFYYDIINMDDDFSLTYPDAADVTDFVANSTAAYDGTLEQIGTQKWLHFGLMQANEAFSEQRRTGFPILPDDVSGSVLERTVRITYPPSEVSNNEKNYLTVQAQDTPTSKVWWDK